MAYNDLTITDGSVKLADQTSSNVTSAIVRLGETVGKSTPVILQSDGTYAAAENDSATNADVKGITLTHGLADDWVIIIKKGPMVLGSTIVAEKVYALSETAGKICPAEDVEAADYLTYLGYALDATIFYVSINATGAVHG